MESTKFNPKVQLIKFSNDIICKNGKYNLLAPFAIGFKRELVHRKDLKLSDVYYYSPEGLKLRSLKEIESYIIKYHSPLNIQNFNFKKQKILIENVREQERSAKLQKVQNPKKNCSVEKKSQKKQDTKRKKFVHPLGPTMKLYADKKRQRKSEKKEEEKKVKSEWKEKDPEKVSEDKEAEKTPEESGSVKTNCGASTSKKNDDEFENKYSEGSGSENKKAKEENVEKNQMKLTKLKAVMQKMTTEQLGLLYYSYKSHELNGNRSECDLNFQSLETIICGNSED